MLPSWLIDGVLSRLVEGPRESGRATSRARWCGRARTSGRARSLSLAGLIPGARWRPHLAEWYRL